MASTQQPHVFNAPGVRIHVDRAAHQDHVKAALTFLRHNFPTAWARLQKERAKPQNGHRARPRRR